MKLNKRFEHKDWKLAGDELQFEEYDNSYYYNIIYDKTEKKSFYICFFNECYIKYFGEMYEVK